MGLALTVAAATFLLAVIWGSPLIELMRRLRLGKQIRIDGPQTHAAKMGTPAMGGVLIIGWTLLVSLVVNIVQIIQALEIAESVVIPLGVMVAYSILGGIDDYQGLRLKPGEGMRARVKIWILAFGRIPLRIPAYITLALWILFQFVMFAVGGEDQVSWACHIGGIVAGAVLVLILRDRDVPLFDREVVTPRAVVVEQRSAVRPVEAKPVPRWGRQ